MESLQNIQNRITEALNKAHRTNQKLHLIGVSKKQPLEKILPILKQGLTDLGENYVQEWQQKSQTLQSQHPDLAKKIRWHFIGHLQRNKVKDVVGRCEYLHTVDRLELAEKISECAQQLGITQKALLQVKLGEEETKSGFIPEELLQTFPQLAKLPNIKWEGLMTIPPPSEDMKITQSFFLTLKGLLDECNQTRLLKEPMTELSMGMSQDFEIAIACGATMIRVGEALFGKRQ